MNSWAKWTAPVLLVVLGALVGLRLGQQSAGGGATSAQGDLLRSDRERFAAEILHRRLLADNEALERALAEPVAVVEPEPEPEPEPGVASIRALKRLQDAKVAVRVTAVQAGRIPAVFAALFGLTDAEVARLNDVMQRAHAEMKEPIVTAANVSMVNGALVVQVPPSGDGEKLRQKLLDEFAATMGPERFAALGALAGLESIDREFDAFGAATRQITIMRSGPSPTGTFSYQLTDARRVPAGGSTASLIFLNDPNQLPEKYRWLSPVLPSLADLQPPTGGTRLTPPAEKK